MTWKDITEQSIEGYVHVNAPKPDYKYFLLSEAGRFTISGRPDGTHNLLDTVTQEYYDCEGLDLEATKQVAQIILQTCLKCNNVSSDEIWTKLCDKKGSWCNCCSDCKLECDLNNYYDTVE